MGWAGNLRWELSASEMRRTMRRLIGRQNA